MVGNSHLPFAVGWVWVVLMLDIEVAENTAFNANAIIIFERYFNALNISSNGATFMQRTIIYCYGW